MKPFMCEDFLLSSGTAKTLYHDYAEKMPIVDYHCHINPKEIAEDMQFENITQAWLYADHYKWRVMRANGVDERFVTGNATDYEKYMAWASVLPLAIGNPLYHWTHLELKRYFGYDGILNEKTADDVWRLCSQKLSEGGLSVRSIIRQSNVKVICTTDDPVDSLVWHEAIAKDDTFATKVLPAWRPDKAVNIHKDTFGAYVRELSAVSAVGIQTIDDLFAALTVRLDHFEARGCRAADHGLDAVIYAPADMDEVNKILKQRLNGGGVTPAEADKFKFAVISFLAGEYTKRGWVMELHYGAKRSNNSRMYRQLGDDTGYDCISGVSCGSETADFLNHLNELGHLPKTILFSLNPNDDALLGTIIGCFQSGEAKGKMQHGSAWWFNDNKAGMIAQLTSFANQSLLGNFLGMLTDSRSFLSYTRHEYFRRILCELIGGWVENGEYPYDKQALQQIVEGVCYHNAIRYFGF